MNEKNKIKGQDLYTIMLGIGKKKSKYRAKRTMNADGTFSDSRKEARLDTEFMTYKAKEKGVLRVVRKERFEFVINGVKLCAYESDWTVYYKDGRKEVFDAKGVRTPVYKIKKKMMKAFFNIDIQEV